MISFLQPFWYDTVRTLLDFAVVMGFGLDVRGRENVPSEGAVLVACNHQSFLDPVLLASGCQPRRLHFLARDSLFRVPAFGPLIASLQAHPVRRGQVDASALRTVLGILRSGEALLMFPEGTRTRDGSIGPLMPGVAALAAQADAWILPACVCGAFECWPRNRPLFRLGLIRLAFGKPFKASKKDRGAAATERLRLELERTLAQLREMR